MDKRQQGKFLLVAIGAFVLYNVPFLQIADSTETILGIPFLYLYIFAVWIVVCVLVLILLKDHAD